MTSWPAPSSSVSGAPMRPTRRFSPSRSGATVLLVPGEPTNLKITTAADLAFARGLLLDRGKRDVFRIGVGYDSHRTIEGRKLMLGGEHIPSTVGLKGHSDGDALCHAITDAILGAAAQGDIGRHFPDTDPQYRDADSLDLLRRAVAIVRDRRFCRSRTWTRWSSPNGRSWRRTSIASAPRWLASSACRRRRERKGQDERRHGRDRARRRHGGPRRRVAAKGLTACVPPSIRPPLRPCASLCAEPHRSSARRQRPDGALQLAARARAGRHVHPAHRGYGSRAIDRRIRARDSRRPALARSDLG